MVRGEQQVDAFADRERAFARLAIVVMLVLSLRLLEVLAGEQTRIFQAVS